MVEDSYNPSDVLNGRGGLTNHHPGNRVYRKMVKSRQVRYSACRNKAAKQVIIKSILDDVRELGGRFLQECAIEGKWFEIGYKMAWKKTSQALREEQPKLKKLMKRGTDQGSLHAIPASTGDIGQLAIKLHATSTAEGNQGCAGIVPLTRDEQASVECDSHQFLRSPEAVDVFELDDDVASLLAESFPLENGSHHSLISEEYASIQCDNPLYPESWEDFAEYEPIDDISSLLFESTSVPSVITNNTLVSTSMTQVFATISVNVV